MLFLIKIYLGAFITTAKYYYLPNKPRNVGFRNQDIHQKSHLKSVSLIILYFIFLNFSPQQSIIKMTSTPITEPMDATDDTNGANPMLYDPLQDVNIGETSKIRQFMAATVGECLNIPSCSKDQFL